MAYDWIEEHVETFIRPNLRGEEMPSGREPIRSISMGKVFRPDSERFYDLRRLKLLKIYWKEIKRRANGRPLLLPGRDVWFIEVLARLDDYPTVFRPEISSCVARAGLIKETYPDHVLIDSGYSGSVPRALKHEDFILLLYTPPVTEVPSDWKDPEKVKKGGYVPTTQNPAKVLEFRTKHQVFPRQVRTKLYQKDTMPQATEFSSIAGSLENSLKYWTRATVVLSNGLNPSFWFFSPNQPKAVGWKQELENPKQFAAAANLTLFVARNLVHL